MLVCILLLGNIVGLSLPESEMVGPEVSLEVRIEFPLAVESSRTLETSLLGAGVIVLGHIAELEVGTSKISLELLVQLRGASLLR